MPHAMTEDHALEDADVRCCAKAACAADVPAAGSAGQVAPSPSDPRAAQVPRQSGTTRPVPLAKH